DVRFERARVYQGGAWTAAPGGGTNCGLRVSGAGTVAAAGITVDTPGAHGAFVTATDAVTLSDVAVGNTAASGINLQGRACVLDRPTAENTNGIGLYASGCSRVEFGVVTLRNTAITHPTHRALDVENNAYVFGGRLWIVDTQQAPTGYVVAAHGSQRG